MFASSIKRRLRRFHGAVDVRQRNVLKSVMHVHSCHFARKNQLFFVVVVAGRRCPPPSLLRLPNSNQNRHRGDIQLGLFAFRQ